MMGFGAGGAATFIELKDTPETYSEQSGKLAKVKAAEDGIELALLLSFTDWYAGGVPTDFPWVFEANTPCGWSNPCLSPIVKNDIGQYIVYVAGYDVQRLYEYNLDTKQWHRLADPPDVLFTPLALSPDGSKLAAYGQNNKNVLYIYGIEVNSWISSPAAPQMNATDVMIEAKVWADSDTVWCVVRANLPPFTVKCFRYVVSTTTWTQFANSITPTLSNPQGMGITPDETALYFGNCGADYNDASKYVIATDTYTTPINLGASYYFAYCSDRNKLWYGNNADSKVQITHYVDLSDESTHTGIFPTNEQRTKPTNIQAGIFETSVAIVFYRTAEPLLMSYSGTGYWKLAEKVLTDYNLVVFKKPADGYAILAIDKVSGFTIPVYLFGTQTLPAGTWEFFYPKEGDYTKLKISGSVLK